jgi:O-antigen/teichoic acid export membrane protein
MSYKTSFISGLTWNGALKVTSKGFSVIKLAILARLLTPTDFGIFSLVLVSISMLEVFTESGINTILVQSQRKIDEYINTAWIFSIVRGFVISAIMVVMSFVLSRYYQEPQLLSLILFASIIPIIRGFINPGIITFYKELDFRKDTFYRMSLVLVDFATALIGGLVLKNTFALVIPIFFSAVADVFISFYFIKVKPKFEFDKAIFKEIFHQTKWLNNISILDYLNKNLDNLIVGKVLGLQSLGFYQGAYASTQSGTSELGLSVIHATFPIYSKLATDLSRLKKAFMKVSVAFLALLIVPTLIFVLFPTLIVQLQFGDQWVASASILPILAVAGYFQAFFNIGSTLFTVRRKYYFLSLTLFTTLVSMVLSLLFLLPRYGLVGGATGVLISRVITAPLFFYFILRTLNEQTKIA